MGATNVLKAYGLYAGKVPPLSMQVLAYMAAVAKDTDEHPWYSQGHEAIARFAMGRSRESPVTQSDIRAVERALTPLFEAKAITTERVAARRRDGSWKARYSLRLDDAQPVDIAVMKRQDPL